MKASPMRIRISPGHVTFALISAFVAALLCTVGYPLLHATVPASAALPPTSAPARHTAAATITTDFTSLASEKAAMMRAGSQHEQRLAREQAADRRARQAAARAAAAQAAAPPVSAPAVSYAVGQGDYSYSGLEALWEANGGSAATAPTAACIAEAESSGNRFANNGRDLGLWQIDPGNFPGQSYDAFFNADTNAADAVSLSADGTNWSDWSTASSCGV